MNEGIVSSMDEMQVHGALMVGFAQACVNLNIVAGHDATSFIKGLTSCDTETCV